MVYSPQENARRVRAAVLDGVQENPEIFSEGTEANLLVIFDRLHKFAGGRIFLFQQYLLDGLAIVPEIVAARPLSRETVSSSRTEISFWADVSESHMHLAILEALKRGGFGFICADLGISHVQFEGETFFSKRPLFAPAVSDERPRLQG